MKLCLFSLMSLALLAGCPSQSADTPATNPAAASAAVGASHAVANGAAQAALDRLDVRRPLPLVAMMAHHQKQNMRDHLVAVQEVVSAIARNDFPTAEKAAGRLGYSATMGQMCTHMGAGTPGFTEAALRFHHDADKIGEAARQRDAALVLTALGQTLSHCTGCHETYKQHVVTDAEWSEAAGRPAPDHRAE